MPAQFENGRKFDGKKSLQDFDAKEKYLHPKNQPVSIQKRRKMLCLHHCRVFTRCCFKFMPVRVPFSKSTVFEICRCNMRFCMACVSAWPGALIRFATKRTANGINYLMRHRSGALSCVTILSMRYSASDHSEALCVSHSTQYQINDMGK